MQKRRNKTETPFPILIGCAPAERGGKIPTWFGSPEFADEHYKAFPGLTVRRLTLGDLTEANLKRVLGHEKLKHLKALRNLSHAFERGDSELIAWASKELDEANRLLWQRHVNEVKQSDKEWGTNRLASLNGLGRGSLAMLGLESGREMDAAAIVLGRKLGVRSRNDRRWALSSQLSEELCYVQPVVWADGSRFIPAFYCSEQGAAFYAQLFMEIKIEGKFWDVCLWCGRFFVKDRPNQDYCTPQHGSRYRMARKRRKDKEQANESKKEKNRK